MSATTNERLERAKEIDRYVELSALGYVISGGYDLEVEPLLKTQDAEELAVMLSDDLFGKLWPVDDPAIDDPKGGEFALAHARVDLLAAQLFELLAQIGPGQAAAARDRAAAQLAEIDLGDRGGS